MHRCKSLDQEQSQRIFFVDKRRPGLFCIQNCSASRREKGPARKGEARAGSERMSSRWTQIAKQNRSAGERGQRMGGSVLCTAPRRARDLAKRDESQGGQQGIKDTQCFVPDMWKRDTLKTFTKFKKIFLISCALPSVVPALTFLVFLCYPFFLIVIF